MRPEHESFDRDLEKNKGSSTLTVAGDLLAAIWRLLEKVGGGRTKPRHGPSEIWAWIQHLEGDANQFSSGESSYCLLADRRSDQSETIALGQCSLVRCVASLWFESLVLRLQGPSAMVSLENWGRAEVSLISAMGSVKQCEVRLAVEYLTLGWAGQTSTR